MTITDVALIVATVAGPILAVQAQKVVEKLNVRKGGQQRIFKALMATRATRVHSDHVQALNMIDLEFTGTGLRKQTAAEREVVVRWRIYADHLNYKFDDEDKTALKIWVERGDELFTDLLEAMAKALGYGFDRVQLRRGIYFPKAHDEQERRRMIFENALCGVVTGQTPLAMRVVDFPVSTEAMEMQMQFQAAILRMVGAEGKIQVTVVPRPTLEGKAN